MQGIYVKSMLEGKSVVRFFWPFFLLFCLAFFPLFYSLIRCSKTLAQYVMYVATKFQTLPLKSDHTWSQDTHLRSMSLLGVNSNVSWLSKCDQITRDEC